MFDIEAEGLSFSEPIDQVVQKLETKVCQPHKEAPYVYGRLLAVYSMMKRVYHGFDRRMKTSSILNAGRRSPAFWLASEEFKKAQVYIDRFNARGLTNYRCFEQLFKTLLAELGDWSPRRLSHHENSLIMRGWYHQSLLNDKIDDYIRAKNKRYNKSEDGESEPVASVDEATAAE